MRRFLPPALSLLVAAVLLAAPGEGRRPACPQRCAADLRGCRAGAAGAARECTRSCQESRAEALRRCDGGPCRRAARGAAAGCRAACGSTHRAARRLCRTAREACRGCCGSGVACSTTTTTVSSTTTTTLGDSIDRAYRYLDAVMDEHATTVDVFTELGSAGDHFPARCALLGPGGPANVALDACHAEGCATGATCIASTFTWASPSDWSGWYLQNGVLDGADVAPACSFGGVPTGLDLSGASALCFRARGRDGGEAVEFFVGGVGWPPGDRGDTCLADSLPRVPPRGQATILAADWTEHCIDLAGADLSCVNGGFGWVANAPSNPGGATVYLDDVRFVLARPDALRLLRSYATRPVAPGESIDTLLANVAWSYDNAVALLAYLARDTPDARRRARLLADAFVHAVGHDRFFADGRIRDAYQAGDFVLARGWTPNGRSDTARMPGRWDCATGRWLETADQVGTRTGNVAWVMLALLEAHAAFGDSRYLDAARAMGVWIEANTRVGDSAGGYRGGFEGWEPAPTVLEWRATEHNLDVYVAFMRLFDRTGEAVWRTRALHAKAFVRAMWARCPGRPRFAAGTTVGAEVDCALGPSDVNTWGLLALGETATYGGAIDWVEAACARTEPCFAGGAAAEGIAFAAEGDGIWWEGTAHTALAHAVRGEPARAQALVAALARALDEAPGAGGGGLVAACRDGVATGIDGFALHARRHVGATAWFALAASGRNPFWGIGAGEAIPHEGE